MELSWGKASIFLVLASTLTAQTLDPPNTSVGSVEGRVVISETKEPVEGATVRLVCISPSCGQQSGGPATAPSGPDGKFRFDAIPTANYLFIASAPGFLSEEGALPTALVKSDAPATVEVRLVKAASLAGKVVDESGTPVRNATVTALSTRYVNGALRLEEQPNVRTTALGEFAVSDLREGTYYVAVDLENALSKGAHSIRIYYPKALHIEDAAAIHLTGGQLYGGVTVRVHPAETFKVSGKVAGLSEANGALELTLSLLPRNAAEAGGLARTTAIKPEHITGSEFVISDVIPGNYILYLLGSSWSVQKIGGSDLKVGKQRLLAQQEVNVGAGDVRGLVIPAVAAVEIKGKVQLQDSSTQNLAGLEINLIPQQSGPKVGVPQLTKTSADGSFVLPDCEPVRYLPRMTPLPGTYVQSITFNEQDALAGAIDVTNGTGGDISVILKTGGGEVSGTADVGTLPSTVYLVPSESTQDSALPIRYTQVQNGLFTFKNVRPGSYRAVAMHAPLETGSGLASFVRLLQQFGSQVEVSDGARVQTQVTLVTPEQTMEVMKSMGFR